MNVGAPDFRLDAGSDPAGSLRRKWSVVTQHRNRVGRTTAVLALATAFAVLLSPGFAPTGGLAPSGTVPTGPALEHPAEHAGSHLSSAPEHPPSDLPLGNISSILVEVSQNPGVAAIGGGPNNIWVNASGGFPPYSYQYSGLPGCPSMNVSFLSCSATRAGWATVHVNVTDSIGEVNNTSALAFYVAPSTTATGTLDLGESFGRVPPMFWGVNLNFYRPPGFASSSVAALVNATPIHVLRLPLVGTSVVNQARTNWSQVAEFCAWISCASVMTLGGPGYNASQIATGLRALENQDHLRPTFAVYGNEPNLWDLANGSSSPQGYALDVQNFTEVVRSIDPSVRILGVEISGKSGGDEYVSEVSRINGENLSGIAVQVYPQNPNASNLFDFFQGLQGNDSIAASVARARADIALGCGTCSVPVMIHEFNGGTSDQLAPYRSGEPDVPFFAASIVQALESNVSQFLPWTLTSLPKYKCDFGMIALNGGCGSGMLAPTYYLYSQLLGDFATGQLFNVSIPGAGSIYGLADEVSGSLRVLVANTNVSVGERFDFGSGFPQGRCITAVEIDPDHPGPAAEEALQGPNGDTAPAPEFDLAPLGVVLLAFSANPATCPTSSVVTGLTLELIFVGGAGAVAAGTAVVVVLWRRRVRAP